MNGASVGITAARRATAQAELVRSLGGVPRLGPSVDLDVPAPDAAVRAEISAALDGPLDVAVFVTGVGASRLLEAAERTGDAVRLREALLGATVVARGVKPRRVLRAHHIPVRWTAEPAEGRVVRDGLLRGPCAGRRILVQCAGPGSEPMTAALRAAGATVVEVHPYTIDPPPDARGAVRLARDAAAGDLAAITFTSAHAVHGFAALAERSGIDAPALAAGGALMVAVGPVTRAAMLDQGLPVHVEPATPRMGAMMHALAARLAAERRRPRSPVAA